MTWSKFKAMYAAGCILAAPFLLAALLVMHARGVAAAQESTVWTYDGSGNTGVVVGSGTLRGDRIYYETSPGLALPDAAPVGSPGDVIYENAPSLTYAWKGPEFVVDGHLIARMRELVDGGYDKLEILDPTRVVMPDGCECRQVEKAAK